MRRRGVVRQPLRSPKHPVALRAAVSLPVGPHVLPQCPTGDKGSAAQVAAEADIRLSAAAVVVDQGGVVQQHVQRVRLETALLPAASEIPGDSDSAAVAFFFFAVATPTPDVGAELLRRGEPGAAGAALAQHLWVLREQVRPQILPGFGLVSAVLT